MENATPEPTPAAKPRAAAIPDKEWTLSSRLPLAQSYTHDSPPPARTKKSVKPAEPHHPQAPLAPSQPGLLNCSQSAPASRLHCATSSLHRSLSAPQPPAAWSRAETPSRGSRCPNLQPSSQRRGSFRGRILTDPQARAPAARSPPPASALSAISFF